MSWKSSPFVQKRSCHTLVFQWSDQPLCWCAIACWYLLLLQELPLHIGLLLLQPVFPNWLLQMVPWAAASSFSPTVSCLANAQCKLCCLLPALINSRLVLIFMLWVVWSEVLLLLQYLRLCFTKLEPLLIWAFHARPKKKKIKIAFLTVLSHSFCKLLFWFICHIQWFYFHA